MWTCAAGCTPSGANPAGSPRQRPISSPACSGRTASRCALRTTGAWFAPLPAGPVLPTCPALPAQPCLPADPAPSSRVDPCSPLGGLKGPREVLLGQFAKGRGGCLRGRHLASAPPSGEPTRLARRTDRKSTRLNSSHVSISYAVFCLKKKRTTVIRLMNTLKFLHTNKNPKYFISPADFEYEQHSYYNNLKRSTLHSHIVLTSATT